MALTLAACIPIQRGGTAELNSLFGFAAYPRGRVVSERINPGSVGPFVGPGDEGVREYETSDDAATVIKHYETIGAANGWAVTAGSQEGLTTKRLTLFRPRFHLEIQTSANRFDLNCPHCSSPAPESSAAPTPGSRLFILLSGRVDSVR